MTKHYTTPSIEIVEMDMANSVLILAESGGSATLSSDEEGDACEAYSSSMKIVWDDEE